MKSSTKSLFVSLLMCLFTAGNAQAGTLPEPKNSTHFPSLNLEMPARHSVKIAGVYWLPDYFKEKKSYDGSSRVDEDDKVNGGDKDNSECSEYTHVNQYKKIREKLKTNSQIDHSRYICNLIPVSNLNDLTCYGDCICKPEFIYVPEELAKRGEEPDGTACEGKYNGFKCMPAVTVQTGEKCDLYCASNPSRCVKKSCKPGVTWGVGEQCTERCTMNSSVCTDKGCKPTKNPGTGEHCTEHCVSNSSICTEKECNAGVTLKEGEQCNQRCASNSSICTEAGCKPTVSLSGNDKCTEWCNGNCTAKSCTPSACADGYDTSCTGDASGSDGCGKTCRKCCTDSCPGYNLSSYNSCGGADKADSCYDTCNKSWWYKCKAAGGDKCSGVQCGTGGTCDPETGTCKCNNGYKKCGNSCILSSKCCDNSGCKDGKICQEGSCVNPPAGDEKCENGGQLTVSCTAPKVKTAVAKSNKGNNCYECKAAGEDPCKNYPSTSCKKYETVASCPTDATKKKCTATCLSFIHNSAFGTLTEVDGTKAMSQEKQMGRIIVFENSSFNVPGKIVTSVRGYLKDMGLTTSLCPTGKPTITPKNTTLNSALLRDVNINATSNLTMSGTSLDSVDLSLPGSGQLIVNGGLTLTNSSVKGGDTSLSKPTIQVNKGYFTTTGNVSFPSLYVLGSGSSATLGGTVNAKYLGVNSSAKVTVSSGASATFTNINSMSNLEGSLGAYLPYKSSATVTFDSKLIVRGTLNVKRIVAGAMGVVSADGGTINVSNQIYNGWSSHNQWGYYVAKNRGKIISPEYRSKRQSCLCVAKTCNGAAKQGFCTTNGTCYGWTDQNNYFRFDEKRTDDERYRAYNINKTGTKGSNDSKWNADNGCKNKCESWAIPAS